MTIHVYMCQMLIFQFVTDKDDSEVDDDQITFTQALDLIATR